MLKFKFKKTTCSHIKASLAVAPLTFRNSRFNCHSANQAFSQHGFIIDPTMNLVWDISDRKAPWLTPWDALILFRAKLNIFTLLWKDEEADSTCQQGSDRKAERQYSQKVVYRPLEVPDAFSDIHDFSISFKIQGPEEVMPAWGQSVG